MLLPYEVEEFYCITVAVELPLWCWEKEVLEVTVERTNIPASLNFIQVGFQLEIAVPANITLVSCSIFCMFVLIVIII